MPKLPFLFQIDKFKLENLVLKNIPVPSNFKIKTLLGFIKLKVVVNSGLESQQYFSGVKATAIFFKCDPLWSKIHQKINPIGSI